MSENFFHPTALVESDQIGPGTRVWAFAHVMAGARIGSNCNIGDHAYVEAGAVGNNVTLKNNVCIWLGVTLEDDVFVGPNATFTNDRHPRSPRMPQVRERYEQPATWLLPTVVERGASIGANATILPGLRLGRYSMIGAGAVVIEDVPPFALVVGSPARSIGDLCRCGQRLSSDFRSATCTYCGETPDALSPLRIGSPHSMTIPFVDLRIQDAHVRREISTAVERSIDESQFILGDQVATFERAFAEYSGADECIGVANGTEALHLTLRALGIGPGDEVITAANTFVATALAIAYAGATPVLVDADPNDYLIDVGLIERAISPRTKAILPVHLYGQPANMPAILEIAEKHGLSVVSDACQAHGARIGDTPVGSFGTAACYSFYPSKNLGAFGDGGGIVTSDRRLAERIRMLRNYGQRAKNDIAMLGYNSRLDTLQAAILGVKLRYLEQGNELRRAAAAKYRHLLQESDVVLPVENPGLTHVYHLYVIRHEQRDELMAHLQRSNVQCGIHYPTPIHQIQPFRGARTVPDGAPVSTRLAQQILSLPMYPELSDRQIESVADTVSSFGVKLAVA